MGWAWCFQLMRDSILHVAPWQLHDTCEEKASVCACACACVLFVVICQLDCDSYPVFQPSLCSGNLLPASGLATVFYRRVGRRLPFSSLQQLFLEALCFSCQTACGTTVALGLERLRWQPHTASDLSNKQPRCWWDGGHQQKSTTSYRIKQTFPSIAIHTILFDGVKELWDAFACLIWIILIKCCLISALAFMLLPFGPTSLFGPRQPSWFFFLVS